MSHFKVYAFKRLKRRISNGEFEKPEEWIREAERISSMKARPYELEFISRIKRDGSGTEEPKERTFSDNTYTLTPLSMSHGTFIASGFKSYVVKPKPL